MSSDTESEELQSKLLQRLGSYADSLLDEEDYEKRLKKVKKRRNLAVSQIAGAPLNNTTDGNITLSKIKKKKRKNKEATSTSSGTTGGLTDTIVTEDVDSKGIKTKSKQKLRGKRRHLSELREELGLDKLKNGEHLEPHSNVETPGDSLDNPRLKNGVEEPSNVGRPGGTRSNYHRTPEVVVFQDPARKKDAMMMAQLKSGMQPKLSDISQSGIASRGPQFSMRKARWDVLKLGITGFDKSKKEEAQAALAIKLGAKPPKNKYVNYKSLLENKKMEKEEEEKKREKEQQLGLGKKRGRDNKKRKHGRDDIGFVDGQLGRFKSGVQVLDKMDIERIKTTKAAKRRK